METTEIKLIMLTEYQKQINVIFDKFKTGQLNLEDVIKRINWLTLGYNCLRVDIKNQGHESNDIKFLEYGADIFMKKPDWLKDQLGIGYQLEECKGDFKFFLECINSGKLKVTIRGLDFKDINSNRLPAHINFTKLTINEHVKLNGNHLVWHDNPHIFEKDCEDQQIFYFDLEYKTLFDYFPQLKFEISDEYSENEIIEIYYKINEYINTMIYLL